MLIKSNFKDYYDKGQIYYSAEPIFYRYTKVVEKITMPFPRPDYISDSDVSIIGFCGKFYPCYSVYEKLYHGDPNDYFNYHHKTIRHHYYSIESIEAALLKFGGDKKVEEFQKTSWCGKSDRRDFERILRQYSDINESGKFNDLFYQERCPIILVKFTDNEKTLIYNPKLIDFEFAKIFNVNLAFQEIEMWLNNQAVPLKPIPEMSNDVKIEAHGFDKFSFRKQQK